MSKKRVSLSIGIPAYNEQENIGFLIESIMQQNQEKFSIKEIIVLADGCTDNTVAVAKKYKKNYPFIKIVNRKRRSGKAKALNYLYKTFKGDYLFQPDADVVLANKDCIDNLINSITADSQIELVSPLHTAVQNANFWGKLANMSYLIFSDASLRLNSGNNAYTVMAGSLLRRSLAKSFTYPTGIIGDQTYLFASCMSRNPQGYNFVKDSEVLFRTVTTFGEWRKLAIRSTIEDKKTVLQHFGSEIIEKHYTMPKSIYYQACISHLIKNPFITVATLLMELYIRLFPLQSTSVKNGMWDPSPTSKMGIVLPS